MITTYPQTLGAGLPRPVRPIVTALTKPRHRTDDSWLYWAQVWLYICLGIGWLILVVTVYALVLTWLQVG